jgi:hypothetical protein
MKGMSQTLYILVAAIIIVVTAVVIITVFIQGVQPAIGLSEAKSLCQTELAVSCSTFGQVPATWNVQSKNVDGGYQSCAQITGTSSCPSDYSPSGSNNPAGGSVDPGLR